jgi:glutamate-1-semialdehyde 2,1-aminomutase
MSGPQTRGAVGSGQELYAKAKRLIPGGTQLLSKRPEMFLPDLWPAYYARAAGDEVWDLVGRCYVDMS